MVSALMQVLERLGGTSLHRWAENVHFLALAILGVFWIAPVLAAIFRRVTSHRPVLWIRFWECPVCGQLNRRSFVKCQRCERALPVGWRDRWETSSSAEGLRRTARRLASMSRGLGWLLFIGLPAGAVYAFRLYSFHQNPLREILGSSALLLLLLALFFFRTALRGGWRSPIVCLIDILAGGALAGAFLAVGFFWAAAPNPPGEPLALVHIFPDGRILWTDSAGRQSTARGGAQPDQVLFHVRYGIFSWPLFQMDQPFITHVEGIPVAEPWVISLLNRGAAALKKDDERRPRVVLLEQLLFAASGHTYEIYTSASKIGLALRDHPSGNLTLPFAAASKSCYEKVQRIEILGPAVAAMIQHAGEEAVFSKRVDEILRARHQAVIAYRQRPASGSKISEESQFVCASDDLLEAVFRHEINEAHQAPPAERASRLSLVRQTVAVLDLNPAWNDYARKRILETAKQ